jgi:hypothetical protein
MLEYMDSLLQVLVAARVSIIQAHLHSDIMSQQSLNNYYQCMTGTNHLRIDCSRERCLSSLQRQAIIGKYITQGKCLHTLLTAFTSRIQRFVSSNETASGHRDLSASCRQTQAKPHTKKVTLLVMRAPNYSRR